MILYHGSNVVVEKPEILKPSHALDFGPGFYTTLNREQAGDFALNLRGRRTILLPAHLPHHLPQTPATPACSSA